MIQPLELVQMDDLCHKQWFLAVISSYLSNIKIFKIAQKNSDYYLLTFWIVNYFRTEHIATRNMQPLCDHHQWGRNQGGLESQSSHKFLGFLHTYIYRYLAKNLSFQRFLSNKSSLKKNLIPSSLIIIIQYQHK